MEKLVMQKLCTSETPTLLLALILDDFLSFCSFLSSKPLHLVYFLLFSPHIVQFMSFFSPLLLSTFLLLLVLLTFFPPSLSLECLGSTCSVALHFLRVELEENETVEFVEQHILLFFQDSSNSSRQDELQEEPIMLNFDNDDDNVFLDSLDEIEDAGENYIVSVFDNSVLEADCSVSTLMSERENEKLSAKHFLAASKVAERKCRDEMPELEDDCGGNSLSRSASVRAKKEVTNVLSLDKYEKKDKEVAFAESLQRDGSLRQEKEWKRTLACKLYEERMKFKLCDDDQKVAEGGEQMDLLWEAYEMNGNKFDKSKSKGKRANKCLLEAVEAEEEEDDEDDKESTTGKLCCLQALRLSTGKMNLGVRRPNLEKMTKVLKGIKLFGIGSHSSKKKEVKICK